MTEPSTWTYRPARGYKWADATPGNTLAKKSGAHSPRFVDPLAAELGAGLLAARPDLAGYPEVVGAWARAEARCQLLDEWFSTGMFKPDGDERPGLRYLTQFERAASDLRARLGLDPVSEAKLARDRATATAVSFDLEALAARGRQALQARVVVGELSQPQDSEDNDETPPEALQAPLEASDDH